MYLSEVIKVLDNYDPSQSLYRSEMVGRCLYAFCLCKAMQRDAPAEIAVPFKAVGWESWPEQVDALHRVDDALEDLCIEFTRRNKSRPFNDVEKASLIFEGHSTLGKQTAQWWEDRIVANRVNKIRREVSEINDRHIKQPHIPLTITEKRTLREYQKYFGDKESDK